MNIKSLIPFACFLTTVGFIQSASATPEITKQVEDDHADLIMLVNALGVDVRFDGYPCDKGWYGAYAINGSQFVLCENAPGDQHERLNTVRHEAWHVLQDIRDCSLKDTAALSPVYGEGMVDPEFVALASKHYAKVQVPTEAEAAWASHIFDAEQINILLFSKAKSCGFKF